ncbi:hypothetical protein MWU75_17745 [Ornithinimicrobium sp. F0845]|uniref:hypothetical protein n=1 Tax=Ornithinimicrobium sp. F0845 TaxID=2926412 RepID=UPI001FF6C6CD|nr:hypothetical protein [Ornithinimicrobium sp. F0845]MCK0113988.1 hypothetical protein [Ornithinimicrobium sp. F0845]
MRWFPVVVVGAVALALASCGTQTDPSGDGSSTAASPDDAAGSEPASSSQVVDPDGELVAHGILMQSEPEGEVEICIGGVAASLPPQCGGPVLEGDFSWDQVEARTASGVTWTDESYYAVGHYTAGESFEGTITLTRPVSADPPEGFTMPTVDDVTFPQLCDDPTADVPDVDQAARTEGPDGFAQEQALMERLQSLDGYVTSWVTDGGPLVKVVVSGDPGEARTALREVYQGPLCVVQRDLPTQHDIQSAQEALSAQHGEVRLLSSGSGGTSGLLEVGVVLADRATVQRIQEIVSPWLTPEQVVITGALQPLG